MVNPYRGEVALTLDGQPHVLRLTLGALVELEQELESDSLVALIERFERGDFKMRDLIALLTAGLRGGGWTGSEADLLKCKIQGGPVEAAQVAGRLLKYTFSLPE